MKALALVFRSLVYFELNVIHGVRCRSSFIHVCVLAPFVKKIAFPPSSRLGTSVENHSTTNVGVYFWVFYSIPLVYLSATTKPLCSLELWEASNSVTLFQDCSRYWGSLEVPCEFWDFDRDYTEAVDCFW